MRGFILGSASFLLALSAACENQTVAPTPHVTSAVATSTSVTTSTPLPTSTRVPTLTPAPMLTPASVATPPPFETTSFKVDARNEYRVSFQLNEGSTLELEFEADLDINVILLGPLETELERWDRVERLSGHSVKADQDGDYVLVFDNSFSMLTPKAVHLRTRISNSGATGRLTPATAIPVPTATPTASPVAAATSTPAATKTAVPTSTAVPTPTDTPTATPAATPTAETWRGLIVAAEDRCSPYDPDDYGYSQSVEVRIVEAMGDIIYGPYTGRWFSSMRDTDIEHIVARSEAHDSGLCAADEGVRSLFSSDLLNLTLASPEVNRHQKSDKDAAEWLPNLNQCWFADRVIRVRREYGLTIDRQEADALDTALAVCSSFQMVVVPASVPASPTPSPTTGEIYSSCEEAAEAGEQRVQGSNGPGRGFPQTMVPSARDGDGDGVVCEK